MIKLRLPESHGFISITFDLLEDSKNNSTTCHYSRIIVYSCFTFVLPFSLFMVQELWELHIVLLLRVCDAHVWQKAKLTGTKNGVPPDLLTENEFVLFYITRRRRRLRRGRQCEHCNYHWVIRNGMAIDLAPYNSPEMHCTAHFSDSA